ncbi:hypothetical protein [Nocardia sp. NBC_01327]|uniref:hypothetical protein n=1 Tax=Nocardia sp. NBC_01327 TaxID=2903593 RepID=UPI002E145BA4|nr:hypothetical protein OG326_18285 [Nocardia sp. NBC_01327]
MTLDEVAAELYGVPPAEFVVVRTERARQARDGGDRALATAIGKLRRPTVAAWTVNLLVRAAPEDIRALLDLGDALREAQRRLSSEQLRTLTTQRQQLLSTLTRKAADLAAAHGPRPGEAVLREVGSTLQAALADPDVADLVRTGTLSAAASYDGFGPAALVAVPAARPSASGDAESEKSEGRRTAADSRRTGDSPRPAKPARDPHAEARRELEQTLTDIESARAALTSAESGHNTAAADLTERESRITTLRAELAHAEDQRRFTAATERATREALRRARQHLESLERRAEQTRKRLPAN